MDTAVVPMNPPSEEHQLSKIYQKKTDKQHVLDNPDTYTGSMEPIGNETYIYDDASKRIISKEIEMIPGLYKLFDEAIVNCRDHHVRQETLIDNGKLFARPVTKIDISVDGDTITMVNDGDGIDIEKHPEYDLWIPEMIFAHLRTSTNYDKTQKKIVGGKNGFGFKLVLIWSTEGSIETVDANRGLKYVQKFRDNLNVIEKPIITKYSKKPYTQITFKPDMNRLGLQCLSSDMISLFHRRVLDIAAVTGKQVKVRYNNQPVPVKHFQHYVDMYIGEKNDTPRIYEEANSRWEYVVCLCPNDEFTQVSFVNGIFTGKGGKHIDYILGQVTRKLIALIKKKKKVTVKANTIKEQLMLFVRCDIENPSFDSQTKDHLTSPIGSFGSECTVSDKFIEKIAKLGVMEAACALTEIKETKDVKKSDGSKTKNIRGLPKLIDANLAGTAKSQECALILCEGDSAKAGIVSGLSKQDRNLLGVYPLKGKLFNVRDESAKRIGENKEIAEIKQILGLEVGRVYTPETAKSCLRYGSIIFMTDQDLDGSHIKGLGINLMDAEWQTLTQIPNFIGFMNTPILKARKGSQVLVFYNEGEYQTWKATASNAKSWEVKYYKGLGTSTGKEFREYFAAKKIVYFRSTGPESHAAIDMVFNKKRASDRKLWLEGYNSTTYLDTNQDSVSYQEFIDQEMIHFSKSDCDRSISNLVDGLKTSLRKILYTLFVRKIKKELKVAQLSGSVSEISGYHHGEASLNGGIVGMAQDFIGSNNINLLQPNGQFGTRLEGGRDAASERYIFTELSPLTRKIFPEADDKVLNYLDDDGLMVEPQFYAPIIPMICVNGCRGIGTGFSTDIPSYDPLVLMEYVKCKISGEDTSTITLCPYFSGFTGTVTAVSPTKYLIRGKYEVLTDKQVRVTELPVGTWTADFKKHLENLIDYGITKKGDNKRKTKAASKVRDYMDSSTERLVDFVIDFSPGVIKALIATEAEYGCNGLEKLLKLYSTRSITNMHAFDEKEQLCLFETPQAIIDAYIPVRYKLYEDRKAHQVDELAQTVLILSNKARFIQALIANPPKIDLRGKPKAAVVQTLCASEYDTVDGDYRYLIRMPLDSQTAEEASKLIALRSDMENQLSTLKATSPQDMWLSELQTLRTSYLSIRESQRTQECPPQKSRKKLKLILH